MQTKWFIKQMHICLLRILFYFFGLTRLTYSFGKRYKSRLENHSQKLTQLSPRSHPQKLTQLSPRSHLKHLVGKRTAQKDAIKDITSDSQVNSYFPYRWSPVSLTLNIYLKNPYYLLISRLIKVYIVWCSNYISEA